MESRGTHHRQPQARQPAVMKWVYRLIIVAALIILAWLAWTTPIR